MGICNSKSALDDGDVGDKDGSGGKGSKGSKSGKMKSVKSDPKDKENVVDLFEEKEFFLDEELLDELKKKFKSKRRRHHGDVSEGEGEKVVSPEESRRLEVLKIFDRFDKWDFEIFQLSELTDGYPLLYMAYVFMVKYELFKKFNIDESLFLRFMEKVQSLYNNQHPFYNCTRSSSVLHCLNVMIQRGLNEYLGDEDYLSSVLACCILYMHHPGLDNEYQSKSESYVSTIYNDVSILENVSCYMFVRLVFENEEFNIFRGVAQKNTKKQIRETVLDMVIATDFRNFGGLFEQFRNKNENGSDFSSKEDIRVLLQVSLLFCSLDYCCRVKTKYKEWIRRKMIGCYAQGDLEKEQKLPVGRSNNPERSLGKYQASFLDKVKQLVKPMIEVFPKMKNFALQPIRMNKSFWQNDYKNSTDFRDLKERRTRLVGLKEKQEQFIKLIRSIPVPEDQARNVPLEVQNSRKPQPTEEDVRVFEKVKDLLSERFSIDQSATREPFEEDAKIFALVDFDDLEAPLKEEERVDSVVKMFDRLDEWNFDVFCLERLLNNDTLMLVTYVLFKKYDWINKFRINEDVLMKFLKTISDGYQRNPYHNNLHATDVMQITNSICVKGGVVEKMSDVDLLAAILGSVAHDLDHPGLNDAFQVHSFSYLAKLYNDRSVLEAHHCAETFRLMRDESMDILSGMNSEQRKDCRQTVVDMIISTDMCNHAKYVRSFNRLIESESAFDKKEDIRVALTIAIKMADVSNPSRPTYLYLQWTNFIIKEFFRQGDKEKLFNLPVSPLMDREKSVISKGQHAFMEYVLIPMFKSFSSVFPKMEFTINLINKNKEYWRKMDIIDEKYFNPKPENRKKVQRFVHKDYQKLL